MSDNESPPRRKLYDDEEDEEEEDSEGSEDVENEGSRKKPKRVKQRQKRDALSRFLDIEAEVSDEEEEDEDLSSEGEAGFITKEGALPEDEDEDDLSGRHHARVDKRRQAEEYRAEKSAEEIARELADRYGRGGGGHRRFTGEMSEIPQRLLMPSVHDASLWQVRVKPGREREIVFSLMRKSLDLEYTNKPVSILSAFQRDSLPGMIYVEARSAQQVSQACNGLVGVYPSRGIHLVPIDEMALLLMIKKVDGGDKIVPGTWVRLKRGKYAGDLAQVVDVTENGEEVGVRFVPRIDLNPREDDGGGRKRKKNPAPNTTNPSSSSSSRPPQRLFNFEEVIKVYGRNAVSKRGQVFVFLGDTYKDGFVEKDIKLNSIILEDVNPTLDEITMFSANNTNLEETMVDLSIIAEASRKAALAVLQPGDHVEVFQGEQAGLHGTVQEIHGDTLTIIALDPALHSQKIDLPARSVRKRFKPGDHVKVMQGKNTGETGLVVSVADTNNSRTMNENTIVTFISDMSMQEISVFSKDLREAAEVGNTTNIVGEYELHDLVQLDLQTVGVIYKTHQSSFLILTQHSQSRLVHPHQISLKKDKSDSLRSIATDSHGFEIRVGDMMKESEGEQRKGRVLHIHQSHFAFLFNRDIAENGGVFVTRARGLVSITPKGALGAGKLPPGADLTKMNPAAAGGAQGLGPNPSGAASGGGGLVGSAIGRGPRDRLIGAHVVVIKGPHKGYVGIVKDTNGVGLTALARVELNTGNKIISIEKGKLHKKLPNGTTEPVEGPGANWRRQPTNSNNSNPYSSMGPPSSFPSSGNRTPSWGNNNGSGGRTPGWGSNTGGRTPFGAGGRTPFGAGAGSGGAPGGGGRTPNPYAAGNQTPAWNTGSKTPNPYAHGNAGAGNQTPAWNVGSKTPNPYTLSSGGGSGGGGQTPAWNVGGRTPNPYTNKNSTSTNNSNSNSNSWGGATPGRWDSDRNEDNDTHKDGGGGWGSPIPAGSGSGIGGWGADISSSSSWNAPTPAFAAPTPSGLAYAPTPAIPSTPGYAHLTSSSSSSHTAPYAAPTPAPTYSDYESNAAPTPGMMPPGMMRGRGYEDDTDMRDEYQPSPTWLLDPSLSLHLSLLHIHILGTKLDKYLDGAYEGLHARVLAASRVGDNFEQTALIKIQGQPEPSSEQDSQSERSFPIKYLLPVAPATQDATAVILYGPRKGQKVKMRQRPDEGSRTELVVVESVVDSGGGGASSEGGSEEGGGGGAFWECQKDWMCVCW
ncbi:transcription elongation factor SPT5 [Lentinula aff. detonsa]|uniref:Transcription elongation factor SPT5 n=1 Tax=Lentinula aff. detonsa TaxID=2804958 RepID=A0AA38NJZ9_9AGAR|nr:transcription elongation factor SPT5 [Lentinula aff. detonsa]